MFVVYEHPKDYPGHFVVRRWAFGPRGFQACQDAQLATTLEEARALVPGSYMRMPRAAGDDAVIVESWVPAWLAASIEREKQ
jgi:hypothetical protein